MLNAVGLDSSDGSILPRLSGNFQDCMLWKLSVCLLLSKSFSKSFIRGSNETDDLVNNRKNRRLNFFFNDDCTDQVAHATSEQCYVHTQTGVKSFKLKKT